MKKQNVSQIQNSNRIHDDTKQETNKQTLLIGIPTFPYKNSSYQTNYGIIYITQHLCLYSHINNLQNKHTKRKVKVQTH